MIFWKANETPEERRRREEFEAELMFNKRLYEQAKNGDSSTSATGGGSTGGAAAGVGASAGPIAGASVKAYLADGTIETDVTDENGNTSLEGDFVKIVATGGIDQITGEENKMVLEARGEVRQCTPINTVVSHCFDIVEGKIKSVNAERKNKGQEEFPLPTIEYIYNNILHPENVEAAFGVSIPAEVYGTDSASVKYYEDSDLPSKVLAVLNTACGENIKYAARTLKEIYSLAKEAKTEEESLDHVYKALAIRWWENVGKNLAEDWQEGVDEGGSNLDESLVEIRSFQDPRALPENWRLDDHGSILDKTTGPFEIHPEYNFAEVIDFKPYAGLAENGRDHIPADLIIVEELDKKGAKGLAELWKNSKEPGGGSEFNIGRVHKEFMKEMLVTDEERLRDPADRDVEYTAGPSVTVRSPKYINTNIIGMKQAFKESFDGIKSKYYSKASDFDAQFNVKHKGETLAKKTWSRPQNIDEDLLNDSDKILVIIPGILGIQRNNGGGESREFWNPFYNTKHDASTGILGTAWYNGTVVELFETEVSERREMYEKAIRQTLSTHSDHTAIDEDFSKVTARKVLEKDMKETVTMYSGWNDTFYQVKFVFGEGSSVSAEIESFSGNIFRTPLEVEEVENIKLGVSRGIHVEKAAKNVRHGYREVWRKKAKKAKNLSKMEKYEDIRSSVSAEEDLWREASDSIISLPPIETQGQAEGRLEGGLLEYDNVEITRPFKGDRIKTKNRVLALDLDTSHFEENNSHHFVHNMYIFPGDIKNGVNTESEVLRGDAVISKGAVISYEECNDSLKTAKPWKKYAPSGK